MKWQVDGVYGINSVIGWVGFRLRKRSVVGLGSKAKLMLRRKRECRVGSKGDFHVTQYFKVSVP